MASSLTSKSKLLATLMAGLLCVGAARGAVIWSGVVDLQITTDFTGVYLDITSGPPVTSPPGNPDDVTLDTYTISYSQATNWDVNFFFGGAGVAYSTTFSPFVDNTLGSPAQGSQILNVAPGTVIQSEEASRTVATTLPGGSGSPIGGSTEDHFATPDVDANPLYSAFAPGSQGYIAFAIDTGGASDQYGWMRVTLDNDGDVGIIHEWAYSEDVGFQVGQIPEPRTPLLILLTSLALLRRRRK